MRDEAAIGPQLTQRTAQVESNFTQALIPQVVFKPKIPEFALEKTEQIQAKPTPWPLVRKRTIPTERPPLVGEI
jgi:hypothetical protein